MTKYDVLKNFVKTINSFTYYKQDFNKLRVKLNRQHFQYFGERSLMQNGRENEIVNLNEMLHDNLANGFIICTNDNLYKLTARADELKPIEAFRITYGQD